MSEIQVFIKIQGKTHVYCIKSSNTILELKQLIQLKAKIPVKYQRLIHCGKLTYDEHYLSDLNVVNGSTFHLQ